MDKNILVVFYTEKRSVNLSPGNSLQNQSQTVFVQILKSPNPKSKLYLRFYYFFMYFCNNFNIYFLAKNLQTFCVQKTTRKKINKHYSAQGFEALCA